MCLAAWSGVILIISSQAYRLSAQSVNGDAIVMSFADDAAPSDASGMILLIRGSVLGACTLGTIMLSYRRHTPQAALARAERRYREKLKELERIKG
jgi:hypothetical protein